MTKFTVEMWRLAVKRGATELGFEEWQKDCAEKAAAAVKADTTDLYRLNTRQFAHVMAGLELLALVRTLRTAGSITAEAIDGIERIATQEGTLPPLNGSQLTQLIEALCEGQLTPQTSGYLFLKEDGSTATIGIHKPGPRNRLAFKELVAR